MSIRSPMTSLAPVRGRPRASDDNPSGIAALDVGLEILRVISEHHGAIGLSDLSRLTGEKPNRLHRYLVSFRERGFLSQAENSGLYDLGPQAYALGLSALRRYDPIRGVREATVAIRNATGNQTNLYVWTPRGPTLIASEQGIHYFPVMIRPGTALPLADSITGLVFLAWTSRDKTQALFDEEVSMAARDGISIDVAGIEAQLKEIRKTDVYWSNRAIISHNGAVMPLFDDSGEVACCVTTVIPRGMRDAQTQEATEKAFKNAVENLPLKTASRAGRLF
jgi:DNA-binding IclR family transcriptional regulator